MSVLMVGNYWNTSGGGGLDRYFVDLATHLGRASAQPAVMVHDAAEGAPRHVFRFGREGDGIVSRLLAARRVGKAVLQSQGVELVNVHFALYAMPLLDLIGSELPVVCHFHGPWAAESQVEEDGRATAHPLTTSVRYHMRRLIENTVYGRSHRFVVLSSAFAELLHREYRVPPDRISVIPGGVDTDRFQPLGSRADARRALGWPEDRPLILSVRRLARRMGLEHLIDAMAEVRRRCPNALLLIGGKGALEGELRQRIAERGLERHVRLVGFIPEAQLPAAYRAADFSVVPTGALEGFGLIISESLACGTPCLGTPVGGIPEVLRPLTDSLLFEAATPAAMADRIIAILHGRTALPDAAACRAYAVDRFSWQRVTGQVLRVFSETQGGHRPCCESSF